MGLIFFLFPFAEVFAIYRFISAYSLIDFLIWIFISGFVGILVVSWGGKSVLSKLQQNFREGQTPNSEILHRGLIVLGGFLLILPGILTDAVGLLMIIPGFRHLIILYLKGFITRGISRGTFKVFSFQNNNTHFERDAQVIEAEVLESSSKTID